ncbi:MAG: DNA polymerase [Anaeroplasmataceae bacterium]
MLSLTRDSKIDFNKYLADLEHLGFVYVELSELKLVIRDLDNKVSTLSYLCSQIMATKTGYHLYELNEKNVAVFLTDYEYCPESMIYPKKKNGKSTLDKSKVLGPLLERGFAKEFITTYLDYTSTRAIRGLLEGLVKRAEPSDKLDYDGNKLYKLCFTINEADNLRVYYKDHNIQSIPRNSTKCMKAPAGYVMVSGDFAQSDLRIAYSMMLKSKETIDTVKKYPDMYEAFARTFMGDSFDLDEFKSHRNSDYKPNTLAPIYGAKSASSIIGKRYVAQANQYLSNEPIYSEFVRRIKKRIDIGAPIKISSYFGNVQLIDKVRNPYGDIKKQKLDKALNAPIQTGTSEIVIACQNSIVNEFAKVGVTKDNGGLYTYLNRHDELVFMIKVENLKYSYIFQNHETIKVDDWVPLKIEFDYCKSYGVSDEFFNREARSHYDKFANSNFEYTCDNSNSYIPIKDVLEISVGISKVPNSSIKFISYLDTITNKCSFEKIDTDDYDKVHQSVIARIVSNSEQLSSIDIDCVHLCSELSYQSNSVFCNVLIKQTNNYSNALHSKAHLVSEYLVYDYCKSNDIPYNASSNLMNNKAYINSTLERGELFKN